MEDSDLQPVFAAQLLGLANFLDGATDAQWNSLAM